jgi:hypothetical protein
MDYFYDGQVRRYLTQFIQIMSNFAYKDAKGQLVRVPVRYGDMTRQVAQILKKNSENTIPSAPFIACYIKDMQYDLTRLQDPTFISKVQIRERAFDEDNNEYLVNGKHQSMSIITNSSISGSNLPLNSSSSQPMPLSTTTKNKYGAFSKSIASSLIVK